MCLSGGRGCHRLKRHCTHKNVAQRDAAAEPVGATWGQGREDTDIQLGSGGAGGEMIAGKSAGKGGCGLLHRGPKREARVGRAVTLHCRWNTSPGSDTATDTPY